MTPYAWKLDVVLYWSPFPEGSYTPGSWVIGVTTFNLVGQGPTPEKAVEFLMDALTQTAAGGNPHTVFLVRDASDVPIEEVREQRNEIRITDPSQANDKSVRYIMEMRFSLLP